MSILAPVLRQRFFDANGNPLVGGKLYSYAAGSSTPLATYTDNTGTVANANPVVLDANGECVVFISSSLYKFVLKTSADVTQWTQDNVGLPTVDNGFTTGDVKMSLKTVADTGWVLMNDLTIGNAASGATGRANADTVDLFTLLWNNTANADCAVSTGRGGSAAADYAANKTIALPKTLGRALACYGSGFGLTARAMAKIFGEENHILTTAELASHNHTQNPHNHTQDQHRHGIGSSSGGGGSGAVNIAASTVFSDYATATNQAATATNNAAGGDTGHNTMQPTLFLNVMIKL